MNSKRILAILVALAGVVSVLTNVIQAVNQPATPTVRQVAGKPGTVKQAKVAASVASSAQQTFAPDPERTVPPVVGMEGIPAFSSALVNGQLSDSALSPIYQGRLLKGPPAATWNRLQLYRHVLHLPPISTNGPASSYRTLAQQKGLYAYWCGQGICGNAAVPGYSLHGWAKAADTNGYSWLRAHGRWWSCSNAPWEGWHSSFCGGGASGPDPGPNWNSPTLGLGSGGLAEANYVRTIEKLLGFRFADGTFQHNTAGAVKRRERQLGWRYPDGVVTASTWAAFRKHPVRQARRRPALGTAVPGYSPPSQGEARQLNRVGPNTPSLYGAAPTGALQKGIDISYSDPVDFCQARRAGYRFAFIRAGYGDVPGRWGLSRDQGFTRGRVNAARRCGLRVGTYWFAYPTYRTGDAVREAHFYNRLQRWAGAYRAGSFVPVGDIETAAPGVDVRGWKRTFTRTLCRENRIPFVEKSSRSRPCSIDYLGAFYRDNVSRAGVFNSPVWVPVYGSSTLCPVRFVPVGWRTWSICQPADHAPGVSRSADLDVLKVSALPRLTIR